LQDYVEGRLSQDVEGRLTGIEQPVFLHRSLQPLEQIDFGQRLGLPVLNGFDGECEGMCGV
jgi:hypothetical protein